MFDVNICRFSGLTVCKMCLKMRISNICMFYRSLTSTLRVNYQRQATRQPTLITRHKISYLVNKGRLKYITHVSAVCNLANNKSLLNHICKFEHNSSIENGICTKSFSTSSCHQAVKPLPPKGEDVPKDKTDKVEDIRESVMTIPNLLTTSRIIATPFLGYLVLHQMYPLACTLFVIAGITDLLDGYIARNFNQNSVFGSALDPIADKLLVSVLTVTLTMVNLIPVPLAVVIVGRDVFLIAVGFYLRYISLPPPITISRYFDITNATVKVHPSLISKINTSLQLILVASSLAAPVFGFVDHWTLQTLWVLTGTTTVASGIGYIITRNNSVQFLQDKMKRKL